MAFSLLLQVTAFCLKLWTSKAWVCPAYCLQAVLCKPTHFLQTAHKCVVPTNSFPKVSASKSLRKVALNQRKCPTGVSACDFQSKTTKPLNQGNPTYVLHVYMQGWLSLKPHTIVTGCGFISEQQYVINSGKLRESLTNEPFREGMEESGKGGKGKKLAVSEGC